MSEDTVKVPLSTEGAQKLLSGPLGAALQARAIEILREGRQYTEKELLQIETDPELVASARTADSSLRRDLEKRRSLPSKIKLRFTQPGSDEPTKPVAAPTEKLSEKAE